MEVLTIGHSTLPGDVFIRILKENGCSTLVDIRTIPKSRHNPQFGQDVLQPALVEQGIEYRWLRELGGLRRTSAASVNTGWRNTSFRGYADYMQTAGFAAALDALLEIAGRVRTTIMCAEAVPWRCHRSLVADALLARGVTVEDILYDKHGESERQPHRMTPFARVDGYRVWYPAPAPALEPVQEPLFDLRDSLPREGLTGEGVRRET
jgi:uncharacterized protein (DUF488 family)